MELTKLDTLLITEVSGVDDPANQLPGWMVTKAVGSEGDDFTDVLLVIADEMEAVTKAADTKKPYGDVTYADPGYQKDGKKRYPLDTEQHVRAAWSYINVSDNASAYSAEQLASIKAKIKAAMKKLGAEMEDTSKADGSESIVAKIKGILNLGAPTGKEGDVEKSEFAEALSEAVPALAESVADAVSKALAPAEGEGETKETPAATETAPEVEPVVALTHEDVTKAVNEAVEEVQKAYGEIFEAVIERVERIEQALGVAAKKSLDGQEASAPAEGEPVTKSTPDLGDAIAAAFKR